MKLIKQWILPIETVSEANSSDHWSKKYSRRRKQSRAIDRAFREDNPIIPLPCVVKLTRISARLIDSDNNVSAFKAIRDQISFFLTGLDKGRGDSDPRIEWLYSQEKGKVKTVLGKLVRGIKIEFFDATL